MLFPVMVDTKLREGLMSSRFFDHEQSTQIICTRHTRSKCCCCHVNTRTVFCLPIGCCRSELKPLCNLCKWFLKMYTYNNYIFIKAIKACKFYHISHKKYICWKNDICKLYNIFRCHFFLKVMSHGHKLLCFYHTGVKQKKMLEVVCLFQENRF